MMAMAAASMTAAGADLKTAMKGDAKVSAMADADVAKMTGDAWKASPDGAVIDSMKTSQTTNKTCKDFIAMDQTGTERVDDFETAGF